MCLPFWFLYNNKTLLRNITTPPQLTVDECDGFGFVYAFLSTFMFTPIFLLRMRDDDANYTRASVKHLRSRFSCQPVCVADDGGME